MPELTGHGAFPPDLICECGCKGAAHFVRWDDATGDFKGTRCMVRDHGGHKFQPAPTSRGGGGREA